MQSNYIRYATDGKKKMHVGFSGIVNQFEIQESQKMTKNKKKNNRLGEENQFILYRQMKKFSRRLSGLSCESVTRTGLLVCQVLDVAV